MGAYAGIYVTRRVEGFSQGGRILRPPFFFYGIYIHATAGYNAERKGRRMWERFTEKARRVIVLAQDEATRLGHGYVGTEHILLGLIKEKQNVAAKTLASIGVNLEVLRHNIEDMLIRGDKAPTREKVFTPSTKKVLEFSFDEARLWNHDYIGTEHMLLGLIREDEGKAACVLNNLGVTLEKARKQISILTGSEPITIPTTKLLPRICPHCGKDINEPPEEKKESQGGA